MAFSGLIISQTADPLAGVTTKILVGDASVGKRGTTEAVTPYIEAESLPDFEARLQGDVIAAAQSKITELGG